MTTETESIDRLFLELSQFTKATTAKEIELARRVVKLEAALVTLRRDFADVPLNEQGRAMWRWIDDGMAGEFPKAAP